MNNIIQTMFPDENPIMPYFLNSMRADKKMRMIDMIKPRLILIDTETISDTDLNGIDTLSQIDTVEIYNDYKSKIIRKIDDYQNNIAAQIRTVHMNYGDKDSIAKYMTSTLDTMNIFKHAYDIYILSNNPNTKPYIANYSNKGYNIKTISSFDEIENINNETTDIDNNTISEKQSTIQNDIIHISLDMNKSNIYDTDIFSEECRIDICTINNNKMKNEWMYMPMNEKKYIFIDTENVREAGFEKWENLKKSDIIRLYRSPATEKLINDILEHKDETPAEIQVSNVQFTMKNAMDCMIINDIFQMTAYRHIYDFIIISNDHDFNRPILQLKEKGFNIVKLKSISQIDFTSKKKAKPSSEKEIQMQLATAVCNDILKSTKFESYSTWLAKNITTYSLTRIKFEITSLFNEKEYVTIMGMLDPILKELKTYNIEPSDITDMPDAKSIKKHLKRISKDKCTLDEKQIDRLTQKLQVAKTTNDIQSAILNEPIPKNKRKKLIKCLSYFEDVLKQINNQNTKSQQTTIESELTDITTHLKWLSLHNAADLYMKLTTIKNASDLKQTISSTTSSKSNQIQLINYIRSNASKYPNIPSASVNEILENIKLLSKEITTEIKPKDKIIKLRDKLSNDVNQTMHDICNKDLKSQKTNEGQIKTYCYNSFDKTIANRLIPIITNMPTKSMIIKTIKYMFRQNYHDICDKLAPIIANKPD